ncbi:MAG: M23 family metallopeptidase [Clostridia bacterium]|nr:M23 family metallopeptidase [Clostridia bacterium]
MNKNKESVQSAINELNSSKSEVQGKYQEALEVARQIDKQSAAYQNMISVLEKDEERVSAEIESYLRRTASKSSDAPAYYTDNGEWGFPLREGYNYISSDYGYRSSGFHKGIDICATTKDKTIVATRAGKVINKGYHYSMGNYVMIDHGDGYVSIYMHMRESAYVSVGEVVAKGQAIGYIGSTGNSTGPHLHFQINKDGTPVNPRNYVRF